MGPTQDIDENSGDETAESLELQVNNFQKVPFLFPFYRKIWQIFSSQQYRYWQYWL
jgi:hypothetical protein